MVPAPAGHAGNDQPGGGADPHTCASRERHERIAYGRQWYVYETPRNGTMVREPARLQNLRSVLIEPAVGQDLTSGDLAIRAMAWSGAAPVGRVEVSGVGGPWQNARLISQRQRHNDALISAMSERPRHHRGPGGPIRKYAGDLC